MYYMVMEMPWDPGLDTDVGHYATQDEAEAAIQEMEARDAKLFQGKLCRYILRVEQVERKR